MYALYGHFKCTAKNVWIHHWLPTGKISDEWDSDIEENLEEFKCANCDGSRNFPHNGHLYVILPGQGRHKINPEADIEKKKIDKSKKKSGRQKMNQGFWIGPYGVRVSNELDHVVAADGDNTLYKHGGQTERWRVGGPRTSQAEYFALYTVVIDGVRWYQKPAVENMDVD